MVRRGCGAKPQTVPGARGAGQRGLARARSELGPRQPLLLPGSCPGAHGEGGQAPAPGASSSSWQKAGPGSWPGLVPVLGQCSKQHWGHGLSPPTPCGLVSPGPGARTPGVGISAPGGQDPIQRLCSQQTRAGLMQGPYVGVTAGTCCSTLRCTAWQGHGRAAASPACA